ncbi:response regulator transcription factor [Vibrio sp. M250220]|uniref:response regulator transcription factor n=1 Tax=Vibrio sp. M250220 TaxID=3020894 RepID=UPI002F42E3B3
MKSKDHKKDKINCLVFDDHPLVCEAIKSVVLELPFINDTFTSNNKEKSIEIIKKDNIKILILDINLSEGDGYDFYKRIKRSGFSGRVLFYSSEESTIFSQTAYDLGADGYVCKSENTSTLQNAIITIMGGRLFFNSDAIKDRKMNLSEREVVIVKYLLNGKTNKEISKILCLSEKTVSTYKSRALQKYGVSNLFDLKQIIESDKDIYP